jgi:hypothetical protein
MMIKSPLLVAVPDLSPLVHEQQHKQDDHNCDCDAVDGIHGWLWRILDFIQCE